MQMYVYYFCLFTKQNYPPGKQENCVSKHLSQIYKLHVSSMRLKKNPKNNTVTI